MVSYENTGFGLEHYAKILKDKGYLYGNHWMPHDAEQREMTNSELAKSRQEVAADKGVKPIQVVKRARNMDIIIQVHIPACRNILAQCWFDEEKCEDGIEALKSYRREWDEKKEKFGDSPVKDWSKHFADAFRQLAQRVLSYQVLVFLL